MDAQIITTSSGERLVVIPEAEYEELMQNAEDVADVMAVNAFRHRLAMGVEELIPAAVANRILDGHNRIRVWREHRCISVSALAEAASVPVEILTTIEEGQQVADLVTLRSIAGALDVTLDDLDG